MLWSWLKDVAQHLDNSSGMNLLSSCFDKGSRFTHQVLISAVSHVIWQIWIERNRRYFSDKESQMYQLIGTVTAEVKCSAAMMFGARNTSSFDLRIGALFQLAPRPSRQISSSPVFWILPHRGCRKINVDGSALGSPSCGAIGVAVRDWEGTFLAGFVLNIGHSSAFVAELCTAMFAIEKAVELNWSDIWIETDSLMVVKAFAQHIAVPWTLRVRWRNCIALPRLFLVVSLTSIGSVTLWPMSKLSMVIVYTHNGGRIPHILFCLCYIGMV